MVKNVDVCSRVDMERNAAQFVPRLRWTMVTLDTISRIRRITLASNGFGV